MKLPLMPKATAIWLIENTALTFAVEEQKQTIAAVQQAYETQGKALNNLSTRNAEIEGEMGSSHMGLQARLMSQALRKLTSNIKKTNTMVIFINQLRMKIGVMFGNPETTTGGNALKFYASVRLDIRRIGSIKKGDEILGNETRVKVLKNKVAPPFKKAEFQILYNQGISRESEIIDLGVDQGFVEKAGAWYSVDGERIGQGKDNAREYLREHSDMSQALEVKIREKMMSSDHDKSDTGE